DADAMRAALAAHDEVLRKAIEAHGGWLFKHTGDGVCAAFASPTGAVDAAVAAQRSLELPVRMGIATGEAELCEADDAVSRFVYAPKNQETSDEAQPPDRPSGNGGDRRRRSGGVLVAQSIHPGCLDNPSDNLSAARRLADTGSDRADQRPGGCPWRHLQLRLAAGWHPACVVCQDGRPR